MRDLKAVKAAVKKNTRMIWIETPSNPLMNIIDIKACADIAKKNKLISVVDNTFLSPYLQQPLKLAADIVVHSKTKYLNGHSDVVGGALVYIVNSLVVSDSPFHSWLVLRGVKTLAQRMEAHQENARQVAQFLDQHKNVKKVYYPGLKSHPQQALIKKQMKGAGGMLSFELDTKNVSVKKFFRRLKIFSLAESLGGVESLIESPWFMSHASMGKKGLKESGITKETIRVSLGIEDAQDLIANLKSALVR